MNNEHNDKQPLNLDDLEQVSGGYKLDDNIARIKRDGHFQEILDIYLSQGKKPACHKLIEYYPDLAEEAYFIVPWMPKFV